MDHAVQSLPGISLGEESIVSYTEKCTDATVDFVVEIKRLDDEVKGIEDDGKVKVDDDGVKEDGINDADESNLEKQRKLNSVPRTTNMHMFDSSGKIKKDESVSSIESDHFVKRLEVYHDRKSYTLSVMKYDYKVLYEKLRFFECKVNGEIVLENVSLEDVIRVLKFLGFEPIESHYGDSEKSFD